MDEFRFDMLTRMLAAPVTRRATSAAMAGGILSLFGLQAEARKKKKNKKRKKKKKQDDAVKGTNTCTERCPGLPQCGSVCNGTIKCGGECPKGQICQGFICMCPQVLACPTDQAEYCFVAEGNCGLCERCPRQNTACNPFVGTGKCCSMGNGACDTDNDCCPGMDLKCQENVCEWQQP